MAILRDNKITVGNSKRKYKLDFSFYKNIIGICEFNDYIVNSKTTLIILKTNPRSASNFLKCINTDSNFRHTLYVMYVYELNQ